MRVILHYGDEEWSGRARFVVEAALLLMERGARVAVTCPLNSAAEQRFASVKGLTVRPVNGDGSWMDLSRRIRRVARELFGEVVLVHTAREQLVVAAALRSERRGAVLRRVPLLGAPLYVADTVASPADARRLEIGNTRMERVAAYMACSGFILSSQEDLRALRLPGRPLPPTVVPVGVDASDSARIIPLPRDQVGVSGPGPLLVCLMSADARARVGTTLRTMALLSERHPTLRLALVGPGSDHDDLRMHAAALGIMHRVVFLGDRDDSRRVLAAADIGWVASAGDTEVYALLDLMASEVAVVGERSPAAASYVADGITGILFPPSDPPAGAAAIATLLADGDERIKMGRAGRTRAAREFGVQPMAEALMAAVSAARDRSRWRRP